MSLEGGSLTTSTISNANSQKDNRSTLKSPKSRSPKNNAQIQQKLASLSEQLAEIRQKRTELKKYDDGRIYGPKKDYTTVPKKLFSHPKLDYVYGEIMFSPYMTNPKDNYPKETYQMADTLKSLKQKNIAFKDLPDNEKPYDEKQLKKLFIREVCNYNPKFNIPKSIKTGTSSKPGTANSSVVNRSSISTASSAMSLKETGSLRRRQLNKLNTRKHASATAMSLDASGFRPSSLSNSGDDGSSTQSAAEAMAEAIAKLTASATASTESTAATGKASEQPESPSRADDQAEVPVEDQYAEDFEGAAPAATEAAAGKSDNREAQPPAGSADEKVAELEYGEEVYDADFEHTGVLPSEGSASQPEPAAAVEESVVADEYGDDFEHAGAPPAQAQVSASEPVSPVGSEKKESAAVVEEATVADDYGDDFEHNAAPSGEEVSEEVASQTPAVKLTKQNTASSEIQEDMPSHASSVPSTVRSEMAEPQPAYVSDYSADLGALEEESAGSTRSTAPRAPAVVLSETEVEATEEKGVTDAVLDEPLEEILYVESKPGEGKDDAAVRNNFLNSPVRGAKQSSGDSNDVEEEGALINVPSSSPGRNLDHPDEEIGEEYES